MRPKRRHFTAIAPGCAPDAWRLAEWRGGRVARSGVLPMPAEVAGDPAAAGARLAAYLKAEGYGAREVAFGLPNRALFATARTLPPLPTAAARAGMLRLAVEKEHGDGRLVFDFVERADAAAALLVAVNAAQLKRLGDTAAAAGRRLTGVTATALCGADADDGTRLTVDADGADLVAFRGGRAAALTRLTGTTLGPASLPADTTRVVVGPATADDQAAADALADRLGERFEVQREGVADAAGAVAEALASRPETVPDFVNRRLAPVVASRGGAWRRPAIYAGVALLLGAGALGAWGYSRARAVGNLESAYAALAPRADALQAVRDRTASAAPWFNHRPETLEVLAALTECFPTSGRIWVTGLRLDAAGAGSIKCRADRKDTMLACLNAMQNANSLHGVELRDWNEADRTRGVVGFEIVFRHGAAAPAEASR